MFFQFFQGASETWVSSTSWSQKCTKSRTTSTGRSYMLPALPNKICSYVKKSLGTLTSCLFFCISKSVQQMKPDVGSRPSGTERKIQICTLAFRPATAKLEFIECDLEKQGDIGPAIGNASTVLCCIGASEKEISDITGPYRIDYKATENLIKAGKSVYYLCLTMLTLYRMNFLWLKLVLGSPLLEKKGRRSINCQWSTLHSILFDSQIVRPGGMERPTDSYKETHNIVLANEDTYFGGQVSNLQVVCVL
ncbi:hypothetical protein B296_00027051 [Ensete ventricosum]|uniref:Uncharacterized protein n=1 Tax=Ensete ventricosum TaxID=4639 RepID=A0A426Z4H4_ENSVE|nr:hypothetical protein B296_00027051 [Ensete ventricosum]